MEHEESSSGRRCRHCGTALTDETTGGLCPRCLLEMNFASRTMPGGEPSPQVPPPSPEEMAARFPQFEILECLGRGGMGIVYKARQRTLDRLVAIKVLAGEWSDDPRFEARFSREARTLAKLSHPNIVTVHDFGESDGMFYLVMEFVDGVNLRDVLHDERMEPEQALAIVPEICAALQFAHDHGVVHRDIKPENILMDRDGRVKIADFGIANLVGADADRSGTPPYMAPEQEAGKGAIDHRTDIYALGVVFYEMLTGERPERDPSKPSHRVEIDVRLDEVVLRALEKEPARRYQTAGEFRTVVETVGNTVGNEPSGASRNMKPSDRGRTMADILAVVMGGGTLRSRVAHHLANASALGFIAFLSFLQSISGLEWSRSFKGFAGFFGLFGMATFFEMVARHKARASAATEGSLPADSPSRKRRIKVGLAIGLVTVLATAAVFWLQRPRMIDDRTIAADSPDGMFSASGQTWHAMRILDSDRTFYRFTVQGKAGAVYENWEVDVPYDKLATSYVLLSRDEVLVGKHGEIVWSDDGKRVSFRVRGTEVSAYNTEDGGHSFQGGFLPQRVVTLPAPAKTGTSFLDLDTGEVVVPSVTMVRKWHLGESQRIQMHPKICEWMRSTGVDLRMRAGIPGLTLLDGSSITMAEFTDPDADSRAFDTLCAVEVTNSAAAVETSLSDAPRTEPPLFGLAAKRVHAVKTREGAVALIEILEESKSGPTRLRYKRVEPETAARAAYVGEWEWREGGGSDDFAVLILRNDGTAVVMEDGEDGETAEWNVRDDDGIALSMGDTIVRAFLDGNERLVLVQGSPVPRFTRKGKVASDASGEGVKAKDTPATPEEMAREYTQATYTGDVERALAMLGGPAAETPEHQAWMIEINQVIGEEDVRPSEFERWHEEGGYAVATAALPKAIRARMFLVLEHVGGAWKVVGNGLSVADSTSAEVLRAFERFRAVDRTDRDEVARAFVEAVRQGDFNLAAMLVGRPMPLDPSFLGREFAKASRTGLPGSAPLRWRGDGVYALTRVRWTPGQPDLMSNLALKRSEGIWKIVWADGTDPEVSLDEDFKRLKGGQMVAGVMVEDLALRFLVAIREKDEKTLRELCVDRTKGWTESLVGHFAMELRERFRQQTGENFTMYPDPTAVRVDGDLAVVVCRAFRDVQKKLGGNILVLHFCRTEEGWKIWTIRNAPESQPIEEHLDQAREWAAPWVGASKDADALDGAVTAPEQTARRFLKAVRAGNYERAADLSVRPLERKEFEILAALVNTLYRENADQLTKFTECHREDRFAVVRLAPPSGRPDISPSLVVEDSGGTWRILGVLAPTTAATSSADHLRRMRAELQRESGGQPEDSSSGGFELESGAIRLPDGDLSPQTLPPSPEEMATLFAVRPATGRWTGVCRSRPGWRSCWSGNLAGRGSDFEDIPVLKIVNPWTRPDASPSRACNISPAGVKMPA